MVAACKIFVTFLFQHKRAFIARSGYVRRVTVIFVPELFLICSESVAQTQIFSNLNAELLEFGVYKI